MKRHLKLLDADASGAAGGAAPSTATTPTSGGNPVPTTTTGTGFNPTPPLEEEDTFLEPTTKPEPAKEEPKLGADGKPLVVVDPAAPKLGADGKPIVEATPAPTTYTPEQVAELLKRQAAPAVPAPVAAPAKPLTPEEIDKKLNRFRPSDADVADLLSGDPAKAMPALNRMGEGMVRNAVTVATIIADDKINNLLKTLQPHIEFAQQQQAAVYSNTYFSEFPTHVGLEPLITKVAEDMTREAKWKTASQKDTMAEVGKRVNDLVGKLNIPIKAAGAVPVPGTPAPAATAPARTRMSTVSTGGQGGAGGTGAGGDKDPEAGIWS